MLSVRIRRRFDTEELIAATAMANVVTIVLIVIAGWNRQDHLFGPPIGATIAGTIAAAFIVDRAARRSGTTDWALVAVLSFLAFAVAGIVGFFIGFVFSLSGSSWVG